MKLFIHIGTEKTGSSFLQTVMATNRPLLLDHGIYFPVAGKGEREMQAGRISAGNGELLYDTLQLRDDKAVSALLTKYKKEAEKKKAKAILLSNETMLDYLAEEHLAIQFKAQCEQAGIALQPMLLVLRDPIDQALSLYKHRAKNGNLSGIESWLEEGYHLDEMLEKFLASDSTPNKECIYRKYRKDSQYLIDIVFKDWLKVNINPVWKDRKVNPSLSLSELVVLSQVNKVMPELTKVAYQRFIKVPLAGKSADPYLDKYYRTYLQHYLYKSKSVWAKCNKRLGPEEQLEYPQSAVTSLDKTEKLSFTPEQTNVLVQLLKDSKKMSFKLMMFWRKIRPLLAKVKWSILNTVNPR